MKMPSACLVLLVICVANGNPPNSAAHSQASNSPTVEALPDGSYRCHPDGTGPFPGILYNHGGLGNAVGGDLEGVCRSFAEIGYIARSQRRPNSVSLDGQLESVLEGFEALRAETMVDRNRLGIVGFSRGGLLTLQAAVTLGHAVHGIALCAPASGKGALERALAEVAQIQASVHIYVAENDQQMNRGSVVNHVALSEMVERALREAGKDVELTIYPPHPDGGHALFFEVREPWWSDVSRFFKQALRSRKVTIEKGLRLENAGTPGLYEFRRRDLRIYYNSPQFGLATAESRNGKKWRNEESAGINLAGFITADASVIRWDGALRLYFKVAPLDKSDSHQVWRATATDAEGTRWQIDGRVYKHVTSPCFDWTSVPHAVVTHDGRVRLYFVCSKGIRQIAAAVSDDGKKFRFEEIVVPHGVDPYVVLEGDGYRLFYASEAPSGRSGAFNAIYSAISDDGLSWGKGELVVTASDLNVEVTVDPAAYLFRRGRYRVYVPTSVGMFAGASSNIYSVQYTPSTFIGTSNSPRRTTVSLAANVVEACCPGAASLKTWENNRVTSDFTTPNKCSVQSVSRSTDPTLRNVRSASAIWSID